MNVLSAPWGGSQPMGHDPGGLAGAGHRWQKPAAIKCSAVLP